MIEADFKREYGIDLADCTMTLSWRRFCSYLWGLSAESRFIAAICQPGGRVRLSGDAAMQALKAQGWFKDK